jgi:hypothetical protein
MVDRSPGTWFQFVVPRDSAGLQIDRSQDRVVVDDAPDLIVHFIEADVFSLECVAQEILTREQTERPAGTHSPDLQVPRILGSPEATRVLPLRALPSLRRPVLSQVDAPPAERWW